MNFPLGNSKREIIAFLRHAVDVTLKQCSRFVNAITRQRHHPPTSQGVKPLRLPSVSRRLERRSSESGRAIYLTPTPVRQTTTPTPDRLPYGITSAQTDTVTRCRTLHDKHALQCRLGLMSVDVCCWCQSAENHDEGAKRRVADAPLSLCSRAQCS